MTQQAMQSPGPDFPIPPVTSPIPLLTQAALDDSVPGLKRCASSPDLALAIVQGASGRNTPPDSHFLGSKQEL